MDLMAKYESAVEQMLSDSGLPSLNEPGSLCGVMFVSKDRLAELDLLANRDNKRYFVLLDTEDHDHARRLWVGRSDPYQWGPSDDRTTPIIYPMS